MGNDDFPDTLEHSGTTTTYSLGCNKQEGQWVRDSENSSNLASNEMLISAKINFVN